MTEREIPARNNPPRIVTRERGNPWTARYGVLVMRYRISFQFLWVSMFGRNRSIIQPALPGILSRAIKRVGGREVKGKLEKLRRRTLHGWAFNTTYPNLRCDLEILLDGISVATTVAQRHRSDLLKAGIGDGAHGFKVELPEHCFDDAVHTITVLDRTSGRLIPFLEKTFKLPARYAVSYRAEVLGLQQGILTGYVYSPFHSDPIDAELLSNGIRISKTSANHSLPNIASDPSAPEKCMYRFNLADLDIGFLVTTELTVSALPDRKTLANVNEIVRTFAELSSIDRDETGFFAEIALARQLKHPIGFDIYIDAELVSTIDLVARQLHTGFYIPCELLKPGERRALSVKYRGTNINVGGSPQEVLGAAVHGVLRNPRFEQWSGCDPKGWQIEASAQVSVTPLRSFAVESGTPTSGLVLRVHDESEFLADIKLTQTLEAPPECSSLTVIILARSEYPLTAKLSSVPLSLPDGVVCREAFIGRDWSLLSINLPISGSASRAYEISMTISSLQAHWIEISMLDAGPPGFNLDLSQLPGHIDRKTNAITDSRFETWIPPFNRGVHGEPQKIGEGWYVEGAKSTDVRIRLREISVWHSGTKGFEQELAYAVAFEGTVSGKYLRLMAELDKFQVSLARPNQLSFYLSKASVGHIDAKVARNSVGVASVFAIERRTVVDLNGSYAQDEKLCTIASRVLAGREGFGVDMDVDLHASELLQQRARRLLNTSERRLFLVFEFHGRMDCAISDVRFGSFRTAATEERTQVRNGYVGLEDRGIATQVGVLKGLEHWVSDRVLRGTANGDRTPETWIDVPAKWSWLSAAERTVDIVICVHNAPEEVFQCLASVRRCTTVPHRVIIVDDGSNAGTQERLRSYADNLPNVELIRNERQSGYTKAANSGMMRSSADWIVLLNSDTILTPGWLKGMFDVIDAKPDVALVGPISNAASWQSVPEIYDVAGKWCVNPLPEGLGVDTVASFVSDASLRVFPEVSLLNGFCTLLRRSMLMELGFLDDVNFPTGYGEENDLCLRAAKAGYKIAIADHVYIYHAKSASFGTNNRNALAKAGAVKLKEKHADVDLAEIQRHLAEMDCLAALRQALKARLERWVAQEWKEEV